MKKNLKLMALGIFLLSCNMNVSATDSEAVFSLCETAAVKGFRIAGMVILVIQVLIPVTIMILGTVDFFKAMITNEAKDMQASAQNLLKRFMIGVIIYFIPVIIKVILGTIATTSINEFEKCHVCLSSPTSIECAQIISSNS